MPDPFTDVGGTGGFSSVVNSIPVIGPLLSGLASLFGFGGGTDPLQAFSQWTTGALQAVGNWISNVVSWALKGLLSVAKFLGTTIKEFFQGVFHRVFQLIDKAHQWLETHLGPIVEFLRKIKAWYDRFFKLYVKPMLDMMQHVRQVLGVLRALHISWAATLDRRIAQVEGFTAGLFSQVRTILNGFIDIFNTVIDPLSIIRKPIIVLSIRRTIHAMIRVGTGLPPGFFFPSPRKGVAKGMGFLPSNFVAGDSTMNPPASSYLEGDDGLGGFTGFLGGSVPDNSSVDDTAPLDYFDDSLYPPSSCSDPATCARAAIQSLLDKPVATGSA